MRDRTAERAGYHHGSLPETLTAAALELLDERGLEQVSVREVARRAGVSPGAPFRHFADRQALLTAVADRIFADFEAWQLAEVTRADGEGPVMRTLGRGFVRFAMAHPRRFELITSRLYTAEQPAELHGRLSGIERVFTETIVADQRSGALRPGDPEIVGLAGQALTYGLSQMIVDGFLPPERAEELVERVLDVFGAGVANSPSPEGG
ncbi:TetR/AcrR family transcriptional regulator [Streptomyces albiaxialis]|uniref:TetR/AcrR family transcriptional regulator n=1 Tax=Streptomyces albiaxialis TaxID=329523 RepID=A0ABN2WJP9_9ACTN